MKRLLTTTALLAALWGTAAALPQNGQVVGGQATITQPNATTLNVDQSTNRAIIDWQGFDIGGNESVFFNLPGANGVTLNRVYGGNASYIYGNLSSNGQLYLINPQGVVFGNGSNVNVGSLLASTATFNGNFMNDATFSFTGGTGSIINQGAIATAPGGFAALVAPTVDNQGTINTPQGHATLAGASAFTLDPMGDGLLTLSPNPMAFAAQVTNSGNVSANGGQVDMATQATQAAYASVVNTSGVIEAHAFENTGGIIRLGNAATRNTAVAGTVAANGLGANQAGGAVQVIGQYVDVLTGARLEANGTNGGGSINVGGNYQGNGPLFNATNTRVQSGALLAANATENGNGGTIIVWGNNHTIFNGTATSQGGAQGGNGGFIEVSGKNSLTFNGTANTLAPNGHVGMLLLDPANITITDGAGGADDAEVSDWQVLEADGGGATFIIAEQALEALAAGTDILLQATNNITINDLTDDELTLLATTNVTFQADSDGDGSGDFIMNASDAITTVGANLSVQGANLTIGELNTSAGANGNIALSTTGGAGAVSIAQGLVTNGGGITVDGNTTLTNNTTLTTGSGAGNIALNGNVTGDYTFIVNSGAGTTSMLGVDVDTLALTAAGTTLNGALVMDTDTSFANAGNITLAGNSTITANDGTDRTLSFGTNTINGGFSLGLTGSDITLFNVGNSTGLTSVNLNASGAASLRNVTTTGAQTYAATGGLSTNGTLSGGGTIGITGNVALGGATAFTSTGGNVTVGGTVDGAQTFAASAAAGTVSLNGAVGGSTPVTSVNASGNAVNALNVATTGNQTYNGATTLNGTYTTTGGNLAFNGATTLGGTTNLNTSTGNGTITFANTLNGAQALTADSGSGLTTFGGTVGGITPLASLSSNGPTTAGNVTTSGLQNYAGALNLNGALQSQTGAVTVAGLLTLLGNSTITGGLGLGDDLTLTGGTTGAFTLGLTAGGADIYLGAANINTLTLASADDLFLSGTITTTTTQDYTNVDDLTLLATLAMNAGAGDVTMNAANLVGGAFGLTLTGDTITMGPVNGLTTLTLNATTANIIANTIATSGAQTYNGPTQLATTLTGSGGAIALNGTTTLAADSAVNSGGGTITFGNTVNGAFALATNSGAGNTTFSGAIGGSTPLTNLTLNSSLLNMAAFTLTGDLNATYTTGTFNGTGQADNITLNGTSVFNAVLTALTDFTQTGATTLGGSLVAGGNLGLNGATTLTADSALTSGGGALDTLTITGSVTGPYELSLAAGAGDIDMTGDIDIGTLTFASGNNLNYGGGTLQALGGIDFTPLSTIYLSGDTNFIGGDGASVRANVTAGGANTILATVPDVDLTIFGDTVTMNQIGDPGAGRLGSLTVDANVASLLGAIYTTGAQTITAQEGLAGFLTSAGGDIILNTTANLVGDIDVQTNGGDIYILQPLNGAYAMSLNAGAGNVYIQAALGNVTPLTTMDIIANIIELSSPITTTGNQNYTGLTDLATVLTLTLGDITYNSPVNLNGPVTLDTSGGNGTITFNSTVDGLENLTLRAGGTGNIVFNDTVGSTQRLGTLTIESTGNITFTQGVYTTNYLQNRINGLANFGYNPGLDATGDIAIGVSHALTGRFTGRDIYLDAGEYIEGEVYAANSLTLTSRRSLLSGTVRNQSGRTSARMVQFGFFYGGPHYFNGYNLPVVDDFYAQADLVAQHLALDNPMALSPDGEASPLFTAPSVRNTSETAMYEAPGSTVAVAVR